MSDQVVEFDELPKALESREAAQTLIPKLIKLGKSLSEDSAARTNFTTRNISQLIHAWAALAKALENLDTEEDDHILEVGTMLSRICRIALVGEIETDSKMFECEPHIRHVVYLLTSFGNIKDQKCFPLQRGCLQVLSNLIASVKKNKEGAGQAEQLFSIYLDEGNRVNQIILRALDSEDGQTILSTLMLVLNIVRVSPNSTQKFLTPLGVRLSAKLMDKMASWNTASEGSMEERCFMLGYQIFHRLAGQGIHSELYHLLGSEGEVMTPSQLTFLKLLDGRIQQSSQPDQPPSNSTTTNNFLVPALIPVVTYAESSIRKVIEAEKSTAIQIEEDPILPRVFEGCILLCTCLIGLALDETPKEHERELLGGAKGGEEGTMPILGLLRRTNEDGKGIIELLIRLLGAAETFLPRQKPLRQPEVDPKASITELDDTGTPKPDAESKSQRTALLAFATLKRDIVQLIGLIVYNHTPSQERVRECGGIQLVLSMCVSDDHNPLIREYALLAVRNLMMNNPENQKVIGDMDPIGVVGEDGQLRDLPERVKEATRKKL